MNRGDSDAMVRELREITESIRSFGGGLKDAANALPGVGFAANAVVKTLKSLAGDVLGGAAGDVVRFGTGYGGTAWDSNALRGAANLPFDPFQAGRYQQPIEAAFNRLGGITGPIARAGGEVDTETREKLAGLLYNQERRAYWDNYENDFLQGKMAERKVKANGVFDGVPGYDMLRRWFGVNVR
jgi:hypothetical protein